MERTSLLPLCTLLLFALLSNAKNSMQVTIEPIPLLTEIEQGKAMDQSVMFRMHSPEAGAISEAAQNDSASQQDLILVLDVSGSMRGAKLAKAKAAISAIVNSLESSDRLHLITYHSSAKIEFTGGTVDNRDHLLAKVADLVPKSTTNLYAGLEQAESILRLESDRVSTKRIFLFSDGLVNHGVTNRGSILRKVEDLREKGTTTAAFGIGSDYDQELMSAIAEVGHSDFFFIQGQEDMEKVVQIATLGFRNLFAADAEIRFTPMNMASEIHVYGQSLQGNDKKNIRFRLGDLRSGDTRTVLVDLKLPGLSETVEYLSYELEYTPIGENVPVTQHGSVSIRVVHVRTLPAAQNSAVLLFQQLQQMLSKEEQIEKQIKLGNIYGARSLEDELEGKLEKMTFQACSEPYTQEQVYACSRSRVAWERTKKSQKMSREAKPEMWGKAFGFKRQMNAMMSASYDEL